MASKTNKEGASGPLQAKETRVNGFHGRDSLQYKAAVYDQLSAALKGSTDLLSKQFEYPAGERLAQEAYTLLSSAYGSKFGLIPTSPPPKIALDTSTIIAESKKAPKSLPARPGTKVLIGRFLEAKKHSLKPASITSYDAVLRPFARTYPELPIEPEPIEAYLGHFSNETTTARDKFNVLRAFYNWLSRRNGLPVNPMKVVEKPAGQADETLPLDEEQARALHDEPKTDREQGYVGLMLDHGFRLSETIRLNVGDIHGDRILVHGKERKEWFPLLGEVRGWLLKLADGRAPDEPLFAGRQGRLSDSQVQLDIRRLLDRIGIDGIRKSPHTLRHTFSTLAYLAGCDWDAVELLLRQKEKKRNVTNRYIHLSPEQRLKLMREKLERYSPLRIVYGSAPQLGIKPDYTQLDSSTLIAATAAELLPELLDGMIALGQMAEEISHALGGNGHRPEQLKEITRYLQCQASK